MNAYGLATRLDIAPDEGAEIMDAYFEQFPSIREFLDKQVARMKLESMGVNIDRLTLEQERYLASWSEGN